MATMKPALTVLVSQWLVLMLVSQASGQVLWYYVSPYLSTRALAVLRVNGTGAAIGTIHFTQAFLYGPVTIAGTVTGLTNGQHGFTVHQYGDLNRGCDSGGQHFNPDRSSHGANTDLVRHVGDLGNIQGDQRGMATVSMVDPVMTLHGRNNVIGRMLVIHAFQDDLGKGGNAESLISGNSGPGVACGIIGLASEIP